MGIRASMNVIKKWLEETACQGRKMKAQPTDENDMTETRREPVVSLFHHPDREREDEQILAMAPCILVMMKAEGARGAEDDRRREIRFAPETCGTLAVQIMFITYDPGHRTREAVAQNKFKLIEENTEEAALDNLEWTEEVMNNLLSNGGIPGTDLTADPKDFRYGPLTENGYLADKRPLYYSLIEGEFGIRSTVYGDKAKSDLD